MNENNETISESISFDMEKITYSKKDILEELYRESLQTQNGELLTKKEYLKLDLPDSFKKRLAAEDLENKKKTDNTKEK
jgi:hypothetical protein